MGIDLEQARDFRYLSAPRAEREPGLRCEMRGAYRLAAPNLLQEVFDV
jgi:hypothetical protein